ncbi:MAG: lipoprotein insertase outer membrane protein LolB [Pseudomonadota bacterium]
MATLAACADFKTQKGTAPTPRAALESISHWGLSGKLGVRHEAEGFSATLEWQQNSDAYQIDLAGPFRAGGVKLRGDRSGVELATQTQTLFASNPVQLMQQELGWALPVDGAGYWVRGLARPGAPVSESERDATGMLTAMHQDGWHIEILGWVTHQGYELPSRLKFSNGETVVKLVVRQWRLL